MTYGVQTKQGLTEYTTRAEAMTAAVLAWDAQDQTGAPVEVIEYGAAAKVIMTFADHERAAIESLIPAIERANAVLLERETACEMGEYSQEREKSYEAFLSRMMCEKNNVLNVLTGAGLRPTLISEEIDVTGTDFIQYNYPDKEISVEQFTSISIGRWSYNFQSREWTRF